MAEKYDAFISYSQAADGRMAPALQRGLQQLARPWHRRRALWIFRDNSGLAVSSALWPSIQEALEGSRYFIVLASPAAARSPWVNKEIAHWRERNKGARYILPVLTEGEWLWDDSAGDLSESSAVPPALRGVFTEEPRHLDLRWARSETDLNLRNARFRLAIADLAAPLHGCPKEDLESEDIRQFRRFARIRAAIITGLAILSVIASGLGLAAYLYADRAVREARVATSRQLAADAKSLSAADLDLALLLSAEAYRTEPTIQAVDGLLAVAMNEPHLSMYLHGHDAAILALRYVGAGSMVSADAAGLVMSWDVATGRGRQVVDLDASLAAVAFSSDGKLMAAAEESAGLDADNSQRVRIVPLDGGPERPFSGHQLDIGALEFAPGDSVLYSADAGSVIVRWDLAAGTSTPIDLGTNAVQDFAVTPDGSYLAAGDFDGNVVGLNLADGRQDSITSLSAPASGIAFDDKGDRLAIRDTIGTVKVWDRSRNVTTTIEAGDKSLIGESTGYLSAPSAVAFRPGSNTFAATTGRDLTSYGNRPAAVFHGQNGLAHSLAFDPSGRALALGSEQGPITVWSATGDSPMSHRLPGPVPRRQVIAVSGDGRTTATAGCAPDALRDLGDEGLACGAGRVTVWSNGRARSLRSPHRNFVTALSLTPDGRFLTSGDDDGVTVRWDLDTDRPERLELGVDAVAGLSSTRGGDALVAGGFNGAVVAWDVGRGQRQVLHEGADLSRDNGAGDFSAITAVTVSGDSTTVIAGDDTGALHAWDRATGTVHTVEPRGLVHVGSIAAEPSRDRVYVAWQDGRIETWDGRLDRLVSTEVVPGSTAQVAVSGDGTLLAIGTSTGVQLRETADGRRLGTRAVADGLSVEAVAFGGPEAPRLLVTATPGRVLSWDLTPETLIAHACATANRDLTAAERATFLPSGEDDPACPG